MLLPKEYQRAYCLTNPNGAYMTIDMPFSPNIYYSMEGTPENNENDYSNLFGYKDTANGINNFYIKTKGYYYEESETYVEMLAGFGNNIDFHTESIVSYDDTFFNEYNMSQNRFYCQSYGAGKSFTLYDTQALKSVSSETELDFNSLPQKITIFGIEDSDGNVDVSGNFRCTGFYAYLSFPPYTSSHNSGSAITLIPCVDQNGTAGMYDVVNGKFYASSNDKEFVAIIKPVSAIAEPTYNGCNFIGIDKGIKNENIRYKKYSVVFSDLDSGTNKAEISFSQDVERPEYDAFGSSELSGIDFEKDVEVIGLDNTATSYSLQSVYLRLKDDISSYIKLGESTYESYNDGTYTQVIWLNNYKKSDRVIGIDNHPIQLESGLKINLNEYPTPNYNGLYFSYGDITAVDVFPNENETYETKQVVGAYYSGVTRETHKEFFVNENWKSEEFTHSIEPMAINKKICYKIKAKSKTTNHAIELFAFTENDKRFLINVIGGEDDALNYKLTKSGYYRISGVLENRVVQDVSEKQYTLYPTYSSESGGGSCDCTVVNHLDFPEAKTYIVTFKNWDNSIYKVVEVTQGDSIEIENPTRNGYIFVGWDKDITNVSSSFTTIAQYESNVDYLQNLFKNSCEKELIIECEREFILNNEDFVSESLSITETISESQQLRFGKCNANELEFKTFRTDINFKGKELKVRLYIPAINDYMILGTYYVDSDKFSADRLTKTVVAYDKLYKLNNYDVKPLYDSLFHGGECTFKELRIALLHEFSIGHPDTELPLDNYKIKQKQESAISGQQLLEALCEANGCFGSISLFGTFHYIFPKIDYENPDYSITQDDYYTTTHEDYAVRKISMIQITSGNIVGHAGEYYENLYNIKDNILFYGKTEAELNEIASIIFEKVKDIEYCPFNLEMYAQPWLEVGDSIKVVTHNSTYNSIVLNRTMSGIIGLKDTYSAKGNELYSDELNTTQVKTEEAKKKSEEALDLATQTNETVTNISNEVEQMQTNMWYVQSVERLPDKPEPMTVYFIRRKNN